MQRSNPSAYHLKRIGREQQIGVPVYLNAIVDVLHRKFVAVRHHATKSGEVPDVQYLINQSPAKIDLVRHGQVI